MKFLLLFPFFVLFAEGREEKKKDFSFVRKYSDSLYWIKGVTIDQLNKEISFSAVVARPSRELEVLISSYDGRTYESIFVADVDPSTVQLCLILIGAVLDSSGEKARHLLTRLDIDVEWEGKGGRVFRMNIENFMSIGNRDKISPRGWIFTGNLLGNQGNIALIYNNLPTVIESPFALEPLKPHLQKSFSTYGFLFRVSREACFVFDKVRKA